MEAHCNSELATSEKSMLTTQSDSKIFGEKRGSSHFREKHDLPRKRVKIRDLESVVQSAAQTSTHYSDFTSQEEDCDWQAVSEKEVSRVAEIPEAMGMDVFDEQETKREVIQEGPRNLDLNNDARGKFSSPDTRGGCVENLTNVSKQEKEQGSNLMISRGINVDLNAEDVTSSINLEATHRHKGYSHLKSKDVSESGSCSGPIEEKDPMRIWKEMKQNGFLSSSHGGIPVPKQRGRKSKNEMLKKKMEIAKREQVSRFTKIAAPSGLLNDLNPGIINHVRNRKQVHSIIEALVRSENNEHNNAGSNQTAHRTNVSTENRKRDLDYMADGSRHTKKHVGKMNDSPWIMDSRVCDRDKSMLEKSNLRSCSSHSMFERGDDILALKLSSSTKALMGSTTLSSEESSNLAIVPSLSLKAATVASQWLELLYQDIKGRLSALRRSRRRVRAVITTELPFLISKEFANNQENDPFAVKMTAGISTSKPADLHRARWTALFDHMDEALSEEEKQLESWLNQVKEKQVLCDQGLQQVNWNSTYGLQQMGTSENDSRVTGLDGSEKELAVNAAAASIYSTCNFLLSES
ncbi:hypothetical protein HN51_017000 [Arachis hypogaea]|uniref:uncharacterized protein isoform X1 n=1 Tax=Arachis hypogaea TaxID=3818 RepID=UPI000DEC347B|nr:uncharacterized protein LOC112755552 isoform X1 [Arachis hypogaea]QHO47641.1 uncharacterized protein DS421_6g197970 [Arachis hypogaea]